MLHSLSFGPLEDVADLNGNGVVSNEEFYDITDPSLDNIDYIFDNFEWPHCTEELNPLIGDGARADDDPYDESGVNHLFKYLTPKAFNKAVVTPKDRAEEAA